MPLQSDGYLTIDILEYFYAADNLIVDLSFDVDKKE